ncbi:hypothetical protein CYMTET_35065, partial [Cymbomonas tetramitiformis]
MVVLRAKGVRNSRACLPSRIAVLRMVIFGGFLSLSLVLPITVLFSNRLPAFETDGKQQRPSASTSPMSSEHSTSVLPRLRGSINGHGPETNEAETNKEGRAEVAAKAPPKAHRTRDSLLTVSGAKLISKEFLWPLGYAPFNNAHASSIIEIEPDEFLVAYFGGSKEGAKDVAIWTSRKQADAKVWDPPVMVVDESGVPLWNPVLFKVPATGEVLLFFKIGHSPESWTGHLQRSSDGGRTWGSPTALPAGIVGPAKNKPVYGMEDGAIYCPSSTESYQAWSAWVEVTRDNGVTWQRLGPIVVPGINKGVIQPSIFFTNEGHLRAFCRSSRQIGKVVTSTSYDGGYQWPPASPTDVPNPNCGFDVVKLTDGRVVMVHNTVNRAVLEVSPVPRACPSSIACFG